MTPWRWHLVLAVRWKQQNCLTSLERIARNLLGDHVHERQRIAYFSSLIAQSIRINPIRDLGAQHNQPMRKSNTTAHRRPKRFQSVSAVQLSTGRSNLLSLFYCFQFFFFEIKQNVFLRYENDRRAGGTRVRALPHTTSIIASEENRCNQLILYGES